MIEEAFGTGRRLLGGCIPAGGGTVPVPIPLPPHYPTWWHVPAGIPRVIRGRTGGRSEDVTPNPLKSIPGSTDAASAKPPNWHASYADLWPPGTNDRRAKPGYLTDGGWEAVRGL